jgi:2-polyprenyl-3-methyl-5-hydroxy-6-metoxy-1,4-benzoquinol methylase
MNEWLEQAGYLFNKSDMLWCRPEFKGIAYSDGDEFEQRMERLVHGVEDKSIFSPELAAACVDWPSYYHLSCLRANILRPFEEGLRGADVLEVGAGCGAITRFLGEAGANVCALEGSPRRARIARMRAVDLPNVTVVAENFETFGVNRKFDVVTFIGVLEYANQFVQGAHPARAMLEKARSMLKPGGMVLVAIENQLGLKYFAGAPEDHVARRMFGIEERYSPDGVRTYGRAELAEIVRDAGFAHARFYAPFPDYKFPVTIFSEEGMTAQDFDAASVLSGSIFSDRQLTSYLSFDLPRVWDVVVRNKLGMDLANSFLVVASNVAPDQSTVLAWHYSSGRTPKFCKRLCFRRNETGDIRISAKLLSVPSSPSIDEEIRIELENDAPYVQGNPLAAELRSLLTTDGWSIEQVAQFVKRYLQIAEDLIRREGVEVSLSSPDQVIPGRFVDMIPQNIIQRDSGDFYLIDKEWIYQGAVSVEWLVFRALSGLFSSLPVAGISVTDFARSRLGFLIALYEAVGFNRSEAQILELGRKEAHLQSLVLGRAIAGDSWGPYESLAPREDQTNGPLYSLQDIVERYVRLQQEAVRLRETCGENSQELMNSHDKRPREELVWSSQFAAPQAEPDLSRETIKKLENRIGELEKTIEGSLSLRIIGRLRALKEAIFAR